MPIQPLSQSSSAVVAVVAVSLGSVTATYSRVEYEASLPDRPDEGTRSPDPTSLGAHTDNSAPVAGKTLTLTMGAESCSQVSDPNGQVACTITPTEAAGPFTVTAGFAGDGNYLAAAVSRPFTVTREETTTTYTGPTVIAQGNPVII
jgi:hypothetical protein